jgi:hypothetical protein
MTTSGRPFTKPTKSGRQDEISVPCESIFNVCEAQSCDRDHKKLRL